MATKTISLDLEAYERLRAARLDGNESFSRVIKRAQWPALEHTAKNLLDLLENSRVLTQEELQRLENAQTDDAPPESKW